MKSFQPEGVCAHRIDFKIVDGTIEHIDFIGGCPGSLVAIAQMLKGTTVEHAIERLLGIPCGSKDTSCPDQLAKALRRAQEETLNVASA